MMIVDGSWTFDMGFTIQYVEEDERTSYERDMFKVYV